MRIQQLISDDDNKVCNIVFKSYYGTRPCFHGCTRSGEKRAIGLEREILCSRREVNKLIIEYKKFKKRKNAKHKYVLNIFFIFFLHNKFVSYYFPPRANILL